MAPNLAGSQHELIRDMIINKFLNITQMAEVASRSTCSIKTKRSNLYYFGNTRAPSNDDKYP
jgi:hypothetical protein